jgi:hypothetical protein
MRGPVLTALIVAWIAGSSAAQVAPWKAQGGRVVLHFLEGALEQSGLELIELEETAPSYDPFTELMEGPVVSFRVVPESDLLALRSFDGPFQPYGVLSGTVRATGGFYLYSPSTGLGVDFHEFEISTRDVRNDGPGGESDPDYLYLSPSADPFGDDFAICYPKIIFLDDQGYGSGAPPGGTGTGADHQTPEQLLIKAWDLVVTKSLADKLHRPDLLGRTLAAGKIQADVMEYFGPWAHPEGQNMFTPETGQGSSQAGLFGSTLDVSLGILSSITQLGHVGTFPNGRTGMSMATTSCNLGDVNVTWLAPMNENHPGIGMALFRDLDGRFEQVGASWIKHGFFALSNSQCIPCQNPSNGTFLGVGCSDTYGTSNNGDRMWLGPRSEWNAFTADWECLGSYFDGTPMDCVRSESGSGNGAVNHRLEAFDADLGNDGATYYYEANYFVRGDQNLVNNIGSRRCTMSWNGFSWQFSTPASGNPLLSSPSVERWGDQRTTAGLAPDDGNVVLAVDTEEISPGLWRYEYALYNWNLDRKVRSFAVPHKGAPLSLYFHDIDNNSANNWQVSFANNTLSWEFPDVDVAGHKTAGALEFGSLYNFGFTSNIAPGLRNATLGIHEAGPGGDLLSVTTRGPGSFELTADDLSPKPNETISVIMRGGTSLSVVAIVSVNDTPIIPPILLSSNLPFVGGEASFPVTVFGGTSGLKIGLLAADLDAGLNIVTLSNLMELAIE